MTGTSEQRPVSYATEAQARAYVKRVTRNASQLPGRPVYLIAGPSVRDGGRWGKWTAELGALLPGVVLAAWGGQGVAEAVAVAVGRTLGAWDLGGLMDQLDALYPDGGTAGSH